MCLTEISKSAFKLFQQSNQVTKGKAFINVICTQGLLHLFWVLTQISVNLAR